MEGSARGERAHELAAQFRAMNDAVLRFAAGCSEGDWRRMVPHEGRSVAYLIDHIAWGYAVERKAILANLTGQAPPLAPDEIPHTWTAESLHAMNAARWEAAPYPDREATIQRLQAEGEEMARFIAGLREQDLERMITYGHLAMPAAAFIERIVIRHAGMHLPGIEQELAGTPQRQEASMPTHQTNLRVNPADETIPAGNTSVHFLVTGADSGGSVALFEFTIAAGTGLPVPHSHDGYEETLYGIEGRSTWTVNGEPIEVGPGQALCIPRGAVHAFMNHDDVDARLLAVISPGILGPAYFREMGELFAAAKSGPPDRAKAADVMRRHGLTPAW